MPTDMPKPMTVADLKDVALPAPAASPDGAISYLADEARTAEAWLSGEPPVGYIRSSSAPDKTVSVSDLDAWAQIVDSMGLREADMAGEGGPAATEPMPVTDGPEMESKAADPKEGGGDHESGIMVALMVQEGDATDLALKDREDALPPEDLHVTLAYLGTTDAVTDEADFTVRALEALRGVATEHDVVTGRISGVGRFTTPDGDCFYLSYDAPELPALRQAVVEALDEAGLTVAGEHGFTPHITLAYLAEGEESPMRRVPAKEMSFDALTLVVGSNRVDVSLGSTLGTVEDTARVDADRLRYQRVDSTAPSAREETKTVLDQWGITWTAPPSTTGYPPNAVTVMAGGSAGATRLVRMLADHNASVESGGLPASARVEGKALRTVYERGLASWPVGHDVAREDWALGRCQAFLRTAAGDPPEGYVHDRDVLPEVDVTVDAAEVEGVLARLRDVGDAAT